MARVVLVTGSRDLPESRRGEVERAIGECFALLVGYDPKTHSPNGADRFAYEYAVARDDIHILTFPADWATHGRAAGPLRNAEMARRAASAKSYFYEVECHAFPHGRSPGTRGCMKLLAERGLYVFVH